MMPSYHVTHPNISESAVVDAPSTEKARTTFLDHLERSGRLNRADRQAFRKDMGANRLHDPDSVNADFRLSYGYEEGPVPSWVPSGIDEKAPEVPVPEPEVEALPGELPSRGVRSIAPRLAEVQSGGTLLDMPIAKVFLRGLGR